MATGVAPKKQILIVDDQELFAVGLRVVIESRAPEFRIVGVAEDGEVALSMVEEYRPDIILMDVRMPRMDGVEATKVIHQRNPEIKILILTTFDDDEYVRQSLGHGAVGYLLKNRPAAEIVESLHALDAGTLQIDPAVSSAAFGKRSYQSEEESYFVERLRELTVREREVLRHMVAANRIVEIADELNIANQTVRNYISSIYAKLGIHDRLAILKYIRQIEEYLAE